MECERKYNERDREKDGEMERKKRKVCLNIPSYTVELRGTERRVTLELAQVSVKYRCKPV